MSDFNEWAEYFDLEKTVKALEVFGIKQPELIAVQRFQMRMFAARVEPVFVPEDPCEYCENMGLDCSNTTRLTRASTLPPESQEQ